MKGYLIAGAALCGVAIAMNAGWIPLGKMETASKPPVVESAPVAVELAPAPEPAAAPAPVVEPAVPAEKTAEAPIAQPPAEPVVQPVATKPEPQPAHAAHPAHPKRHAKPGQ